MKDVECPHCFDEGDEAIEYISNAQSYRCNSCGAHWIVVALRQGHYFANGEVHFKNGLNCIVS